MKLNLTFLLVWVNNFSICYFKIKWGLKKILIYGISSLKAVIDVN